MTVERDRPRYTLDSPLQFLPGVGPGRAKLFEKLDLRTVRDILYFFPRRYIDVSRVERIARLEEGATGTILATVAAKSLQRTRRGLSVLTLLVEDATGRIECVWFNQPFREKEFHRGDLLFLHGEVRRYRRLQIHPKEWSVVQRGAVGANGLDGLAEGAGAAEAPGSKARVAEEETPGLIPIYPATQGIGHKAIRRVVRTALERAGGEIGETLPDALLAAHGFPGRREAIRRMHAPEGLDAREAARRRLVYEEFLYLQMILAMRHRFRKVRAGGIAFRPVNTLVGELYGGLPFTLTDAQTRVIREVFDDMASDEAMSRLIQGDVGSGKTIVSLFAMLRAVENGCQAALMAPTEILAAQHRRKIEAFLEGMKVRVECLTGGLDKPEKARIRGGLADGSCPLVVGTHALIQETVSFHRLGLVVVDEQHRFGVNQRVRLMEKGGNPDCLVMTATPIPRSLALTLYGDLDLSVIDEMPPGRRPVVTRIVEEAKRPALYDFIRTKVGGGERVFVVFPLVEESEKLDLKDAISWAGRYREEIFPDLRVGLVHGRLNGEEKDRVMRAFESGRLDILVSTTVIEVGVDMPEASIMVVEHAERFGLSQLHQLRGRVGRGDRESYCLLFVSEGAGEQSMERLAVLEGTTDGFRVAEEDLRIRGPGEFLGTRQHGLPDLGLASLVEDRDLLDRAREDAFRLLEADPHLRKRAHRALKRELNRRYREKIRNIRIG